MISGKKNENYLKFGNYYDDIDYYHTNVVFYGILLRMRFK